MEKVTESNILNDLEKVGGLKNPYKLFLDLEHIYQYSSGSRINLYGDETRWAIVFEKTCFSYRDFNVYNQLNYFGNCLLNLEKEGSDKQFSCNFYYFNLVDTTELNKFDQFDILEKGINSFKIRNIVLEFNQEDVKKVMKTDSIYTQTLVRYLDDKNPNIFRATDIELRSHLPKDLPKIMSINKWHHKSYSVDFGNNIFGTKPSDYETYPMIAKILVSRDTSLWKPTLKPNNHWTNWLGSGTW